MAMPQKFRWRKDGRERGFAFSSQVALLAREDVVPFLR